MLKAASEGNDHADWLASLLKATEASGLIFWVENPDGSFLWWQEAWLSLGCRLQERVFRLDYCRCGCPWRKRRKRTRFFTNGHLTGQTLFCHGDHVHQRLVGWSKFHRACWTRATRVAQVYPRVLCRWIAVAVLIDAGLLPERHYDFVFLWDLQTR